MWCNIFWYIYCSLKKGYQIHLLARTLTQIQLWDLGDWGHFVAFFYLQTKKRLTGKTIYDVELDQLYNKIQVINFLNQMIKDVNCYEQWIRLNTFENYGMYKLFITQLSQTQLSSFLSCNKLPHFVIKMYARFHCLQKIVLKKVQNKNSIPTAKMPSPPPKKKDKKNQKSKIQVF